MYFSLQTYALSPCKTQYYMKGELNRSGHIAIQYSKNSMMPLKPGLPHIRFTLER